MAQRVGQMDGQTDKQTENLPILQDFVPYLSVSQYVSLSVFLSVCLSFSGLRVGRD